MSFVNTEVKMPNFKKEIKESLIRESYEWKNNY